MEKRDILVSGLCKHYGAVAALSDFSARFPVGKISCIMGPSGCGKTTLLSIMMGLTAPDRGSVSGVDYGGLSVVFQDNRLCEGFDVMENLLLPEGVTPDAATRALEQVGLAEQEHTPIYSLSGGMKRRVAILRAMLAPGSLVLMDEPFVGLDAELKQDVMDYVKRAQGGRTIIIVTHDAAEAACMGDEIIRMESLAEGQTI